MKKIKKYQKGGIITDNNGYYNPDNIGKPVRINSNSITMQGIPHPLLGISNAGDTKIMQPNHNYHFKGESVVEYPINTNSKKLPMAQDGKMVLFKNWDGIVEKKDGTVGTWGTKWVIPPKDSYSLYPKGKITEDDIKYLKSLKDKKVDGALSRMINNSFGEIDSDVFKQLLKTKKLEHGGYIPKELDDLINFTNYNNMETAKSGIHIKPENRGKFTAYKKRTGKTTEEALHSKNPHVRQMANFARNAKGFKHDNGGDIPYYEEGTEHNLSKSQIQHLQRLGYELEIM